MNNVHIIHHNDADGFASAYLVDKYIKQNSISDSIRFYVVSYKPNEIDNVLKQIKEDDMVYIVDYSLQPEKMIELLKITKNVIWIDHHASAIDKYENWYGLIEEATGVFSIDGIREIGLCGAALTYLHLFEGWSEEAYADLLGTVNHDEVVPTLKFDFQSKAPSWLLLVNDWDVWDHNFPDTKAFNIAISNQLSIELFTQLDNDLGKENLRYFVDKGNNYLEFRDSWAKSFRDKYGQVKQLDFKSSKVYDCYVMNLGNGNSDFFGNEINNHDICVNYCDTKDNTVFSLYSTKDDINVGALASNFGGGGHKGAAGFVVSKTEARNILNN